MSGFFTAFLLICIFLLFAYVIKNLAFKKLILPASLIAGLLALLAGPEVLGHPISQLPILSGKVPEGLIADKILKVWKEIPQYLITVVFACLFLGQKIPTYKQIVRHSLPNLTFGYTLALGQYLVGLFLAVLLLKPVFNIDVLAGALIAIGFQGGHGTVAGLQSSFSELGFSDGTELGMGMATIGIISAVVLGSVLSNLASKRNNEIKPEVDQHSDSGDSHQTPITLQLGFVSLAILLGWISLEGLKAVEGLLRENEQSGVIQYIPLFPLAMLGGLVVQKAAEILHVAKWINPTQIRAISKLSLDMLVVAALGSLSLKLLANHLFPFLILATAGITYNLLIYFLVGGNLLGRNWKQRGLGELGQSMGTTAIGLILIQRKGQQSKSVIKAFSYKQPFYEPIVGGGLITSLALPLIAEYGPWYFMGGIGILLILIWVMTRLILQ